MASVFDGDLRPLCGIIHDEDPEEFVRSRMIEAIALLTLRGDVPREWSEQFLRECYDRLRPQDRCYVWSGWQQSIAWLGLSNLKPLVERALHEDSSTNLGFHTRISKEICSTRSTIPMRRRSAPKTI